MKKLLAFFLAMIMIASMPATVFAEANIGDHGEAATIIVSGIFQPSGGEFKTISVDLVWDEMTFTYVKTSSGDWDPGSHEYVGGVEGAWSEETRTITLTNHSDIGVTAALSFEPIADVEGIFTEASGTENDNILELASGIGTTYAEAPAASAEFGIRGEPIAEDGALGLITISIQAAEDADVGEPRITGAKPALAYNAEATETGVRYIVAYDLDLPVGGLSLLVFGENLEKIEDHPYYKVGLFKADGELYHIFDVTAENFEPTYSNGECYLKGEFAGATEELFFAYSNDGGETWTFTGDSYICEFY